MRFRIHIIGIDGSGKSTLTPLLAKLVTAEYNLTTIGISDDYWGNAPQEDLFRPGFMPDGTPLSVRLARFCQRLAQKFNHHRRLYPLCKLGHLFFQERAARILAQRYEAQITIHDGHLLLSAAGRIINYLDDSASPAGMLNLDTLYRHITSGQSVRTRTAVPGLKLMRWLYRYSQLVNGQLFDLPDALIFLDVEPETALTRLKATGQPLDPHENFVDLVQARWMYQRTVNFYCRHKGEAVTAVINTTHQTIEQTLSQALHFLTTLPLPKPLQIRERGTLGNIPPASKNPLVALQKALSPNYLFRYLLPNIQHGSLKELTFPFSQLGQLFLQEGYSAAIMEAIYTSNGKTLPLREQYFLQHPLHQAVYHRFRILNFVIETELRQRLQDRPFGQKCKVLTAPSGYAQDLLQPLKRFVAAGYDGIWHMKVIASDLDSTREIERRLRQNMAGMGVGFHFIRGDLTTPDLQATLLANGRYDIVLFIGLSSWIDKPQLIQYLKFIVNELLLPDGLLITDCFSPDKYALSGKYIGYKANYYDALEFSRLLTYCGFGEVAWISTPNNLNHTLIAHRLSGKMNMLYESFIQYAPNGQGYSASNLKICSPGSRLKVAEQVSTSSRSVSGVA